MKNLFKIIGLSFAAFALFAVQGAVVFAADASLSLTAEQKDCMMKFNWSTEADDVKLEGYAVFLKQPGDVDWSEKPFALLKKVNKNYDYYNLLGMPDGNYTAKVAAYDYDVNGFKFWAQSNEANVDYKSCTAVEPPVPNPDNPNPAPVSAVQKLYLVGAVTSDGIILHYGFKNDVPVFHQYEVTRWETKKGVGRLVDTKTVFYTPASKDGGFVDTEVVAGHSYAYKVAAVVQAATGAKKIAYSQTSVVVFVHSEPLAMTVKVKYFDNGEKAKIILNWHGGVKWAKTNGYALYKYEGEPGSQKLTDLEPVILKKTVKGYEFKITKTGTYNFKLYQFQKTGSGALVFHQPGAELESVEVKVLID
ncbi:hypothetical protein HZC21_05950 [Candidatus Peregrinibacteria bacterium]|nr:hypothetical protein [Candidatus Peregrinibacteria bacterium]